MPKAASKGAIVINQDITKARRAELALREREASLAQAQAQARLGSWKLDVDSGALEWSDECYRIFGLPIGTPVSYASMLERVHPDDRVAVDRQWRAALAGASYDIQHRILVGEVRWVRQRARIEFEPDGSPRSGIGTAQEITEIKLKEQELLRSRQLLRDLAAHHELIREQERARIAREIHDELGQYLTALRMDTAMIQMRFARRIRTWSGTWQG
jgi:PAS domain S-box-containing protein